MDETVLNKNMVDGQIKPINGMSEQLLSAFYSLNRNDFMPETLNNMSYVDKNIILENNRTILKPELIAKIALFIDLKPDENVLVLGSSTGYLSAILSHLAETVIVVEEDERLLDESEKAVKKNNINNIVFIKSGLSKGYSDQSPFNAIIIEGAVQEVPRNILEQLEEGGRLLAIIDEGEVCSGILFTKTGNKFNEQNLFNCYLPALDVFKKKNSFSF
jgi:protein-L-isoaspartate(D-aspartate) O-methyltransferase